MAYKLLKPCIVPGKDGNNSRSYRQFGEDVEVHSEDDAERLVRGGFIEKVEDEKVEAANEPEKSEPEKSEPAPDPKTDKEPGSASKPAAGGGKVTSTAVSGLPPTGKDRG